MRILWHSVLPLIPSGYGTQTKIMVQQLKALGHDVAISCTCGAPMTTMVWQGIKCFPDSGHVGKYGMDIVKTHADRWGADVVISWLDAFVIPEDLVKKLGNWAAWVPVDSEPIMIRNVAPLKLCKWTLAPTRWGVRMLNDVGLKNAMFLPCAYNPDVFFPMPDHDKAKLEFGDVIKRQLDDKFVVSVVSANSADRKNFQAIFEAWGVFHKNHPDALLYMHTDATGYFNGGYDLVEMATLMGVRDDSMVLCSQWEYSTGQFGEDYLNLMHNASDVHLNCCFGEGFGLPIMDAQATGCPTVVPDFAAAGEIGLCYKVKKGMKRNCVPGAYQFLVDPMAVVEQLERAYEDRKAGKVDSMAISEMTEPWQVEQVVSNHLIPVLETLEGERKR